MNIQQKINNIDIIKYDEIYPAMTKAGLLPLQFDELVEEIQRRPQTEFVEEYGEHLWHLMFEFIQQCEEIQEEITDLQDQLNEIMEHY